MKAQDWISDANQLLTLAVTVWLALRGETHRDGKKEKRKRKRRK